LHADLQAHPRVQIFKYESRIFKRGLQANETPFPLSPKLGPYLVEKPVFGAKNYYYCTCGQSSQQPFCDSSHKGSAFKPIKFSLDEKSERLHLCGCKLTSQAPFCDGKTCKKIVAGEPFEEAKRAYEEAQKADQAAQTP
jgi:CDGSH-type Zn-finger protein